MSGPWMACQDRQLSYLAEQTADISHITSEENFVPDTLFRPSPCCWYERAPGSLVAESLTPSEWVVRWIKHLCMLFQTLTSCWIFPLSPNI